MAGKGWFGLPFFALTPQPEVVSCILSGGGSRAAAPVAKDFMTFLFDREKAMEALTTFEAGWGGTIKERMDRNYAAWKAGIAAPDPGLAQ